MGRSLPTGPYRELLPLPRPGDDARAWSAAEQQVDPGEQLLWAGRPSRGLRLQSSDAFFIPFGLLWGVFALLWEALLILFRGPIWFHAVGVPSALFALYLVVGRSFRSVIRRARTVYALTDRRAILVEGGGRTISIDLGGPLPVELREGRGGRGTIRFSWPGLRGMELPGFIGIRDARAVFELLQDVQRKRLRVRARRISRRSGAITPAPSPAPR